MGASRGSARCLKGAISRGDRGDKFEGANGSCCGDQGAGDSARGVTGDFCSRDGLDLASEEEEGEVGSLSVFVFRAFWMYSWMRASRVRARRIIEGVRGAAFGFLMGSTFSMAGEERSVVVLCWTVCSEGRGTSMNVGWLCEQANECMCLDSRSHLCRQNICNDSTAECLGLKRRIFPSESSGTGRSAARCDEQEGEDWSSLIVTGKSIPCAIEMRGVRPPRLAVVLPHL